VGVERLRTTFPPSMRTTGLRFRLRFRRTCALPFGVGLRARRMFPSTRRRLASASRLGAPAVPPLALCSARARACSVAGVRARPRLLRWAPPRTPRRGGRTSFVLPQSASARLRPNPRLQLTHNLSDLRDSFEELGPLHAPIGGEVGVLVGVKTSHRSAKRLSAPRRVVRQLRQRRQTCQVEGFCCHALRQMSRHGDTHAADEA